ncbi:hypothetical protein GCM10009634_47660 [Saccharothrix xinjiangensis]
MRFARGEKPPVGAAKLRVGVRQVGERRHSRRHGLRAGRQGNVALSAHGEQVHGGDAVQCGHFGARPARPSGLPQQPGDALARMPVPPRARSSACTLGAP